MLRGLYTAASGIAAQQRRHDAITNDIANVNTPGYKQTTTAFRSFPELMVAFTNVEEQKKSDIGSLNLGVLAEENVAYMKQGGLFQTNRMTDFAIMSDITVPEMVFNEAGKFVDDSGKTTFQPQAFFTISDFDTGEQAFTRGGHLISDPNGYLTTGDGSRVLGADGEPIQLPDGVTMEELSITPDFRLINSKTSEEVGQFLISRIDNPNELVRAGDGKFTLAGRATATPVAAGERVEIRQGYIESSNVDATQSMVNMMAATRAYEANQKVIQFYDRSLDKAVNEVGKL